MDDVPNEVTSGLIDLSELDLAEPETLHNPVLAGVLAKMRDELEHHDPPIVGHDSSF